MVVRVRFTIDKASDIYQLHTLPGKDGPVPGSIEFAVDLEFRTYLGPVLISVKKMPRGYLSKEVYENLKRTLYWQESDGSLSESLGRFAKNPENPSYYEELKDKLVAHRQCLADILWGENTWGCHKLADEVEQKLRKLANKGLYLELVLHEEMHQYIWETLHFELAIAGDLSIVRMRVEDVRQGNLRSFCLSRLRARMLTIIANPDRRSLADLSRLAQRIRETLVEVRFLRRSMGPDSRTEYRKDNHVTLVSTSRQILDRYTKGREFNIWFLIVHGSADNGGLLYYENSIGQPQEVELVDLYNDCRGRPPEVCVAFTCDIGGFGSQFVNGLLGRDVMLVVAMQAPISFDAAEAFAGFWKELDDFWHINLRTLEEAVKRARAQIPNEIKHERIIPVLYTRARYGWPGWAGPLTITMSIIVFGFLFFLLWWSGVRGRPLPPELSLPPGEQKPTSVPIPIPTPEPTFVPCTKLDVKTFSIDRGQEIGQIEAGTTYTITFTSDPRPDLIIVVNIFTYPPGCHSQPTVRWKVSDDEEDRTLVNFQDFTEIGHPAPSPGKTETISVFIEDKMTHKQVSTYLILRTVNQEESRGGQE